MRFRIKALGTADGKIVETALDAADESAARRMAADRGLRVLSLRREGGAGRWSVLLGGRGEKFPLLLFSQELATLLAAGLPLVDSIEGLAEKEANSGTRAILEAIVRRLYEGKSFSQALAGAPAHFPELYVALMQSSERTGELAQALNRYITYQTRVDLLRQKIVGASVYPLMLLGVGGAVLLFLLGYVVPRFSVVFEDMGSDLPWLSKALMEVGRGIHQHQSGVGLGFAFTAVALWLLLRNPTARAFLVRLVLRVKAVADRLTIYELARLYRSLGILMQGGIPVVAALGMVRGLLGIQARSQLDNAAARIREGIPLSAALEQNGLATPVALRMLRAGEQSGQLGEMMERTADFYDEETNRWVDWFMRLFEPLLMVFVGGMIGIVVILMYIPIFELASSIQ